MKDKSPILIRVRDRRKPQQFSIENRLLDEWFPIIGLPGYALYNLYVRMAGKSDERCYPGYSAIAEHLQLARATISDYNKLLAWCGLVHVEPGNRRRSNDYYILDVPPVTPELLAAIRRQAQRELAPENHFLSTILKRLDRWRPIQAIWSRHAKRLVRAVRQGQLPLVGLDDPAEPGCSVGEPGCSVGEPGCSVGEPGCSVGEPGCSVGELEQSKVTIQSNNPHQQQAAVGGGNGWDIADSLDPEQTTAFYELLDLGVRPQTAAELALSHPPVNVQRWIDHERATREARQDDPAYNPAGFVIAGLRRGEAALLPLGPYRYAQVAAHE